MEIHMKDSMKTIGKMEKENIPGAMVGFTKDNS